MADRDLRTVTTDSELALTHAWFVRCVDSINAALVLHDQGLGRVADPLVRSAMEHAVGMRWLRQLGHDALFALGRSHQRWAANVQSAVAASNEQEKQLGRTEWSPELDAVFDELAAQEIPEGSVDGEWKIENRFKVAKAFDLYVAWLSETATSHATQASAAPYVVVGSDRYHLLRSPRSLGDTLELRCASVAVDAFRSMGEALGSDVWRATVDRLDERLTAALIRATTAGLLDPPSSDDWSSRFEH
ncbi:hypothetical protein GCM10009583_10620 [Ornithinicoccus hortensis]